MKENIIKYQFWREENKIKKEAHEKHDIFFIKYFGVIILVIFFLFFFTINNCEIITLMLLIGWEIYFLEKNISEFLSWC